MELPLSSPAKCELRSFTRFLNAKNNSPCVDIKNVWKWFREFNEGRINVHDEQRSGRPSLPESTVNRRITLEEIEDGLNEDCSHFSVHKIVSETFGYRKVSARWVDKWLKEAAGEWYNTGITKLVDRMKKALKEDKKYELSKMETKEIRAVIKYLCEKRMSPKKIYEDMVDILKEDAPSYSSVKKWSVTQENIDKIHDLIMLDRRMTVRQIEETLGIPKTTVDRIMREHLGLRKLSARWVPKPLTPDQKALRRKLSSDNLVLFEANPEEFINRFVTMDETWAHHFTPESKKQSMQWRHSGSPPPKKAKTVPSAGKGQTITGNYYANLVKQLREAIKEKRRGMLSRKIVYHQDNAPSHRSLKAMAANYDSGFEPLPHAPYSPDLAPSDFQLFPHLKQSLSGIHFRSDEEVIDAVTSFFESLKISFFLEGIKALEHRWKMYRP
ncbi:hypothetical protein LAZ67_3001448 [Cordylochernes scorpioides]|uniref:Mos1 transposase HTH domain-containing protein n=1 Tax=Cordylochernes scorpioides TaxID=51811 RepID=A0ABY6K7X7_9ARAC|nr:hypothetical protein LAZ67_3001448 [Cordylochernes scorpioides]